MGNPIGRSPLARELSHLVARSMSLGMETNGIGFHGFIVELPGAFVRGSTLEEAVSKVPNEARSYLAWLGKEWAQFSKARVVQTHRSGLMVEDADCEILLSVDSHPMSEKEFRSLVELTKFSGHIFTKLYESTTFRDWIDEARIRTTFYGQNKKTIREIFDHVKRTQYYYLSRAGVHFKEDEAESFLRIRDLAIDDIARLFRESGNSKIYHVDKEKWTLKKILRRFIWHDRIHGKAITRTLERQRQLGVIDKYEDPFMFKIGSTIGDQS